MKKPSVLMLLAAGVLFAVFFANVSIGAAGQKPVFGDIQEMLILFAASVCFAVVRAHVRSGRQTRQCARQRREVMPCQTSGKSKNNWEEREQ